MDSDVRRLFLSTGIHVPCLVQGAAPAQPLLLLHAWGESRRSFDRLAPLLEGFRIFVPDLRGHGEADKPATGYSLEDQARDVAAILDALGLRSAAVLGSSSGGYVAQQLAVMQPERVDALVLAGSPLTLQGRPAFADEVEAVTDPLDEDWVRQSLLWFPLGRAVPQWYLDDRVADGLKLPAHVWKSMLAGLCQAAPPTETGTIRAPALILWGEQDGLLPRSQQETLAARIPGSVLKTYAGTGHVVLWECPELVAADTRAFLAQS
ncbi:alpha/beta hydrolase [Arthrobacter sp. BB-1]|uniref:alpha/beta fold hydrolase n=1 Tax=unclassified Arthrobacter TaxID=235627 RepID=UPI0011121952|nr:MULTISPECIES: alpha/beta hydrolase [unclassified Arthrobacter]TNB70438.1 alpha/beta hydrolase [Arthrobacter sp. BB-1]